MSLAVGIVGLPNVGKSTLFQALTRKEVNVANYPFATIDPNVGVVEVPDARLDKLAEVFRSAKKIPAIVEFVDIAGLVKGAHEGEGLGNQFLANIREVQALCHVVRSFEDPDIQHVAGAVDPERDMETVEMELLLKDMETVEKRLQSAEKEARAGKKEAVQLREALEALKTFFDQGKPAREFVSADPDMAPSVRELQLLTAKPVIFLVNSKTGEVSEKLQQAIAERGGFFAVMNLREELEASKLSEEDRAELGISSKLPELIRKAYEMLDLITFFTAGEKESRAWTIMEGSSAPQAAGEIHTDFEKNFIKAQVIPWDKLAEAGSYAEASSQGRIRTEGKEYVVRDGDVLEIKHSA